MAGFFDIKSDHTKFLIIFTPILASYITAAYYPKYTTVMGGIAMGIIVALILGMTVAPRLMSGGYSHIDLHYRVYPSGVDQQTDVWVEQPDPSGKYRSVFSMNEQDKDHHDKPNLLLGRNWFVYLVKTGLQKMVIGDFGPCEFIVLVLPNEWHKFLSFNRRSVNLLGEWFDFGSSEHLDAFLAPHKVLVKYLDLEIPVMMGVMATMSYSKMTKNWPSVMDQLARLMIDMPRLVKQEQKHIWPEKQIPEITVPSKSQ